MNKMSKRILSIVTCICLCMSMVTPVWAASINFTATLSESTLSVKDEEQSVTVTIAAETATTVDAFELNYIVPEGWTASVALSSGVSSLSSTPNESEYYIEAYGSSVVSDVTDLVIITYTIPAGTTAGKYTVGVENLLVASDANQVGELISDGTVTTTLTIENASTPTSDYTATLSTTSSNNEVVSEGSINVNVAVSHSSDTVFNAGEIKLTYDSTKLTPNTTSLDAMVSAGTLSGYKVNNNELVIEDFGSDKNMSYIYSIPFTAAEVSTETTDTVTLTRAAFIHKDNASSSDLIEAAKSPESLTVTIKVAMVNVTLTNSADSTETTTITQKGVAYIFAPTDTANYTYSNVTATVDGQAVTVTDNNNGTFTIAAGDVTGDIALTYTKTAKSYDVTVNGEGTNDEEKVTLPTNEPTYNVDYVFTVPADKDAGTEAGYTYALTSITIGGSTYAGYQASGKTYTIPGTDITGDIVITITKTEVAANTFTVGVDGTGAGNATVDNEGNLVSKGGTASITVTPEDGYTYTVTAKMGNDDATVSKSENTYTVANVSANVTFTVTKTLDVSTVKVTEYVKIDSYVVYLVTYNGTLADGKAPTYDGNVMFWSDSYNAYCWLVIDSTLTEDTAKEKINAQSGTATKVDYGMDINGTDTTDAADAQMVWNMYNALYSDFTSVSMAKFLAADQNATATANWGLNVQDAQVIITAILAGNATT